MAEFTNVKRVSLEVRFTSDTLSDNIITAKVNKGASTNNARTHIMHTSSRYLANVANKPRV